MPRARARMPVENVGSVGRDGAVHYARPPWGYPDGKSSFFHDGFSSTSPRASSSGAPHPRICPARAPQARNPGALGMALAACRARPWPVHPLSRSPGGTAARSSERGEPHSMRGRGAPARRTRAKHAPIAHVWPPIGQHTHKIRKHPPHPTLGRSAVDGANLVMTKKSTIHRSGARSAAGSSATRSSSAMPAAFDEQARRPNSNPPCRAHSSLLLPSTPPVAAPFLCRSH